MSRRVLVRVTVAASSVVALAWLGLGCDPADSLTNQEYRVYLENYESWQATEVVEAFNKLEEHRAEFPCGEELEAARRASWREKAGPVKLADTPEGKAFQGCLGAFGKSVGMKMDPLRGAVAQHWVGHAFGSAVQARIDAEVAAAQQRLGQDGCGGDECEVLAVVGDVAVPRAGLEVAVAWDDARDQCRNVGFAGLSPWRLPTRDELVAMRKSGKLASDPSRATYWSSTRELDKNGGLKAFVVRFDVESLDSSPEAISMPFDRDGVPTIAKVRCVHDLGREPTKEAGEVQAMEDALLKAGCPRSWSDRLRLRDKLLVTWQQAAKKGDNARQACKELGWCRLSWRLPSGAEARRLAEDPWFSKAPEGRCVASLP